ncbi:MAG: hypothetical protein J5966_04625 [Lachnospiraceae bacterium]|nr:hypothetical protein [Lachnospiraceae bacterium]
MNTLKNGIPVFSERTYKILTAATMLVCHACMLLVVPLMTMGPVLNIKGLHAAFWYTKVMYFPLPFIFMIPVEAFFHTRSRGRYLTGMLAMALISEIPFDLATLGGSVGNISIEKIHSPLEYLAANRDSIIRDQNVLFSIALGFAGVWAIDRLKKELKGVFRSETVSKALFLLSAFCISFLIGYMGYVLRLDHKWWLPISMILLYLFHDNRFLMCLFPTLFLVLNGIFILKNDIFISCVAGGIMMFFYNGKRGKTSAAFKKFFYWFYPVHLLIIYILQAILFNR